jgi:hypothetical protein
MIRKKSIHRRTYLIQGLREKRKTTQARTPRNTCGELREYCLRRRYKPKEKLMRMGLIATIGLLDMRDLPHGLQRKKKRAKTVV